MSTYSALVVGTNYDTFPTGISGGEQARAGLYKLRYAEADARDMAAVLGEAGCRVVSLFGENATQEAILTHLRQLRNETEGDGKLVFYFSGHGVLDDETAYLMPVDANAQAPDVRGLALNALAQRYLLKVGQAVALLDCCHSGYAAGLRGTPIDRTNQFLKDAEASFGHVEGHRILAACGGEEAARELAKLQHGAFTYYALEHLRHYTGEVDVGSLYGHIARGLQKEGLPTPVSGGGEKGLIVLRAARETQIQQQEDKQPASTAAIGDFFEQQLDILEQQGEQGAQLEMNRRLGQESGIERTARLLHPLVSDAQAEAIVSAVRNVARPLIKRGDSKAFFKVYLALYSKYQIRNYTDLPAARYQEALDWLAAWYAELQPPAASTEQTAAE